MTCKRLLELVSLAAGVGLGVVVIAQFLEARAKARGWWDRDEGRDNRNG